LLHEVCDELELGHDQEWLLYLLRHAGRGMREALEEGWHQEYLAEYILGISEALTSLALIDYYLVFLRHEGYLGGERADAVVEKLSGLQGALSALVGRLREALRACPDGMSDGNSSGGLFSC
jgi:hypothetical protein